MVLEKTLESPLDCIDSIFKSRDITLSTKVRLVKAMVFPVVMYGCESWIVKKAEPRIILKCQKVKKLKTTIKLSKLIKMNDYTVLSVYFPEASLLS